MADVRVATVYNGNEVILVTNGGVCRCRVLVAVVVIINTNGAFLYVD